MPPEVAIRTTRLVEKLTLKPGVNDSLIISFHHDIPNLLKTS